MDKLNAIMDLSHSQSELGNLFFQAELFKKQNDYPAASKAYQEYVQAGRNYLNGIVDFNSFFPESPLSVREVAQTLVNALMVSSDIESSLGQRDAAEALRVEAMSVSRKYLGRTANADNLRSQAASLKLEGRFNEAIVALMEARDVVIESDDKVALARIAIDIADIWQWLGDFSRALEEINHAHLIIEPIVGDKPITQTDLQRDMMDTIARIKGGQNDISQGNQTLQLYRILPEITYYRGLIFKSESKWEEAQACFEKVLPHYISEGVGESIVYHLAGIMLGRGEYTAALQVVMAISNVFENGPFRAKRPVLYKLMAQCLHGLKRLPEALQLLRNAVEDLKSNHYDPDALWRTQYLLGNVLADTGDTKNALTAYHDAITTVSFLRRAPLGYRLDSTFLKDKMELYSNSISLAVDNGLAVDCCAFMDSVKSRTLRAVLSIPGKTTGVTEDVDKQFDELSREIDAIEFATYRDGATLDKEERKNNLLEIRANLLERARISDTRWRRLSEPPQFDISAVSDALKQRSQAAISLYYHKPYLTCVLQWQSETRCAKIEITQDPKDGANEGLKWKLDRYVKNLLKPTPDILMHDLSSSDFGVKATDLIPADLLELALTADSLVFVPHGLFHLLPWATLIHQEKRLFQYLPVALFPNMGLLAGNTTHEKPRSISVMGVSNYPAKGALRALPNTSLELQEVCDIYRQADIMLRGPYIDSEATEANYARLEDGLQGGGHLLHLSCHGTVVPREPMNSGLLLFDSKLDAAELARSKMPYDEVVLSACSTGWRPTQVGKVTLNADEILGIPGAFLEAGAKSVLVSIPKASDAAARTFTTHYHRQRVAGAPPLIAMQAAQKQIFALGIPVSDWAGFTLYTY